LSLSLGLERLSIKIKSYTETHFYLYYFCCGVGYIFFVIIIYNLSNLFLDISAVGAEISEFDELFPYNVYCGVKEAIVHVKSPFVLAMGGS